MSLFDKFRQLTFQKWSSSSETRRDFYTVAMSSLKSQIIKLPNPKHIDNALFMEDFPIIYDIKEVLKSIYLIVTALCLANQIEDPNGFNRTSILEVSVESTIILTLY
jgi:hypothetical protein